MVHIIQYAVYTEIYRITNYWYTDNSQPTVVTELAILSCLVTRAPRVDNSACSKRQEVMRFAV